MKFYFKLQISYAIALQNFALAGIHIWMFIIFKLGTYNSTNQILLSTNSFMNNLHIKFEIMEIFAPFYIIKII